MRRESSAHHAVRSVFRLVGMLMVACALLQVNAKPAQAYYSEYDGYANWEDDDNPGRSYEGLEHGGYTILDNNGRVWWCARYLDGGADDELVIYGYAEGTTGKLEFPPTLSMEGKAYTVVGLVSGGDVRGEDDLSDYNYSGDCPKTSLSTGYNVTGITIPSTVRFIGKGAFNEYEHLTSVTFAEGSQLESIEAGAFANCTSLLGSSDGGALSIPSSVKSIGECAFSNCPLLENIVFPAGASIHSYALAYNNTGLKSIDNAPAYLEFSDGYDDTEPTSLTSISYSPGIKEVRGVDDAPSLSSITLPDGVKGIVDHAFEGLPALTSINFPSSLIYVGTSAFEGDRSLSSIQGFSGNVSYIGHDAFSGCESLRMHVNHPGALSDQYVNSGITGITFKASGTYNEALTSLDCWDEDRDLSFSNRVAQGSTYGSPFGGDSSCLSAYSFEGCVNLSTFEVIGGGADSVWVGSDGALYAKEFNSDWSNFPDSGSAGVTNVLVKYPAGKSGGAYSIPADVKAIAPLAFADCKFSDITLPVTLEWLLVEFENYDDEGDGDHRSSPFSYMASEPTVHYVAGSWVDDQVNGGSIRRDGNYWYSGIYRGPKATMAGPAVEIVYSMDGGIYNPNSPTSVAGGSSVTIPPCTHERLEFRGWWRCLDDGSYDYLSDCVLMPQREELVRGKVTIEPGWYYPMKYVQVKPAAQNLTYTGKAQAPNVTATYDDGQLTGTLEKDKDYTISYANNTNVGKAIITLKGIGYYTGTVQASFNIVKAANPLTVKPKSARIPLAKLKKANKALPVSKVLAISKAQGTKSFKKVSGNAKIAINTKTGKVTVKKGLKKGTYKVKVKVTAAGDRNYNAGFKTVTFNVAVK